MISPSLALPFSLTPSLSVFPLLVHRRSFAFTAHSSSATAGNARTLQCALNCTPPSSSCLRVFTSSGRNSRKGGGKGEREWRLKERERERARTPKLNCRGKWQAGHEWGNAELTAKRRQRLHDPKLWPHRCWAPRASSFPLSFFTPFYVFTNHREEADNADSTSAAGHRFEVNDVLRCVIVAESLWLSHCVMKERVATMATEVSFQVRQQCVHYFAKFHIWIWYRSG